MPDEHEILAGTVLPLQDPDFANIDARLRRGRDCPLTDALVAMAMNPPGTSIHPEVQEHIAGCEYCATCLTAYRRILSDHDKLPEFQGIGQALGSLVIAENVSASQVAATPTPESAFRVGFPDIAPKSQDADSQEPTIALLGSNWSKRVPWRACGLVVIGLMVVGMFAWMQVSAWESEKMFHARLDRVETESKYYQQLLQEYRTKVPELVGDGARILGPIDGTVVGPRFTVTGITGKATDDVQLWLVVQQGKLHWPKCKIPGKSGEWKLTVEQSNGPFSLEVWQIPKEGQTVIDNWNAKSAKTGNWHGIRLNEIAGAKCVESVKLTMR